MKKILILIILLAAFIFFTLELYQNRIEHYWVVGACSNIALGGTETIYGRCNKDCGWIKTSATSGKYVCHLPWQWYWEINF